MSQSKPLPAGAGSKLSLPQASPVASHGCPHDSCIIAAIRGARQGLYYGGRIRIAHSIVMQILFGQGDTVEKLKKAVRLSWEHGRNLGLFVFIYKITQCVLTNLTGKRRNFYAFVAGIVGASVIWRERNVINQQLFFYLFSRVCEGIVQVMREKNIVSKKSNFSLMSVLIWGIVMYLFERDKRTLQPSLASSMTFLYHDSNRCDRGWRDFVPFEFPVSTTASTAAPGATSAATQASRQAQNATVMQRSVTILREAGQTKS